MRERRFSTSGPAGLFQKYYTATPAATSMIQNAPSWQMNQVASAVSTETSHAKVETNCATRKQRLRKSLQAALLQQALQQVIQQNQIYGL